LQELDGTNTKGVETLLGDPKKAILKLAFPMILAMGVQTVYNLVDAFWVAGLGSDALAAVGFFFPFFFMIVAVSAGIGVGASSAISRNIGAKDKKGASSVAAHAMVLMLIFTAVFTIPLLVFTKNIFTALGATSVLNQTIRGILFIGSGPDYNNTVTGVVLEQDTVHVGLQTLDLVLYDQDGAVAPNTNFYWYANYHTADGGWNAREMFLDAGATTTNAQGRFTLQLNVPSEALFVRMMFDLPGDYPGHTYDADDLTYFKKAYVAVNNDAYLHDPFERDIVITLPKVELGVPFEVKAQIPQNIDSGYVICQILPGEVNYKDRWNGDYGESQVTWWPWEGAGNTAVMAFDQYDSQYQATLTLPSNIEKDGTYTLFVGVADTQGTIGWYNYEFLVEGAEPTPDDKSVPAEGGDFCLGATMMPFIGLFALMFATVKRRNGAPVGIFETCFRM